MCVCVCVCIDREEKLTTGRTDGGCLIPECGIGEARSARHSRRRRDAGCR